MQEEVLQFQEVPQVPGYSVGVKVLPVNSSSLRVRIRSTLLSQLVLGLSGIVADAGDVQPVTDEFGSFQFPTVTLAREDAQQAYDSLQTLHNLTVTWAGILQEQQDTAVIMTMAVPWTYLVEGEYTVPLKVIGQAITQWGDMEFTGSGVDQEVSTIIKEIANQLGEGVNAGTESDG